MPKFVVATYANEKVVRTSLPHIKTAIKEFPGTTWDVKVYNQKFDLANVCKLLEGLDSVETVESFSMNVTEGGTCRKA